MKLHFLGTGTSHGVPSIDCMRNNYAHCPKGVCREAMSDRKHNRTRSSVIIEYSGRHVLIDVSSDFRQQALRERIPKIDAVLITHCHADHIGGIPDIRSFTGEQALPFYGSEESIHRIKQSYDYIFNPPQMRGGGIPNISLNEIAKPFDLFGKTVVPIRVEHGSCTGAFGYRIENLAYIPDVKSLPGSSKDLLAGVDVLILDALRDGRPHSTHMILPESIALSRELKPAKTYFTHLCHTIHYKLDSRHIDKNMAFAYDGLSIKVKKAGG
jgi:phosphoribosyl 1,2-cyclic phosphate phosphodiesterase